MRLNILYYFKEALISFRRNWVMSLASVTTIFVSMLLVGAFVIIGIIVGGMTRQLERRVEIIVYLKDGLAATEQSRAELDGFQKAVLDMPEVESVTYVSKTEAMERMRERLKEDKDMLEQVQGNPLPASYEIKMKDPREVETVVGKIKAVPSFRNIVNDPESDVNYGQKTVRRLFQLTRIGRIVFGVFIVLLAFASLVLIANTIRLGIFARRKEIAIMRLVGASNWFIRWPFLVEGMLQGAIGAALAIAVIAIARARFFPQVTGVLAFMHVSLSASDFSQLMLVLAVAGVIIGLMGSAIALRRFLKV